MKRIATILAVALLTMTAAHAQQTTGDKINSVKISSIRPTGLSSLTAVVTVNVTSSREVTTISDISGTVYSKNGAAFVLGTAQPLTVRPGTTDVDICGSGSLAPGVGFMGFVRNISYDPNNYTADINCTVKTGNGEPHRVELKGVSMAALKR